MCIVLERSILQVAHKSLGLRLREEEERGYPPKSSMSITKSMISRIKGGFRKQSRWLADLK